MHRIYYSLIIAVFIIAGGCSQAKYRAASLPKEFTAPRHVSARHVDLTSIQRNSLPSEWLQPGDQIDVSIATGIETGEVPKYTLTIDNVGNVNVPLVGLTPIAGLNPNTAADRIRDDSIRRGLYVDPKVTVSIKQKRTFQVQVGGAVNKPAIYQIPAANCDLLTALAMAEGVADDASRFIQIRHSPTTLQQLANQNPPIGPNGIALASFQSTIPAPVMNLDLADIQRLPPESLRLYDGSSISVTREPKRTVSVLGLVRVPQQVTMPPGDFMLLDAIAGAGGTTLSIADKVFVIRQSPSSPTPIVIKASLANARSGGKDNLMLAAGDVVSVEETPSTIVLQTISTFFRVGFSAALPGT